MADDKIINGVASTEEEFYDPDQRGGNGYLLELTKKVEALERERDEFVNGNEEQKEEIKKMELEIKGLRSDEIEMKVKIREMESEVERSQEAQKAAEAIAARAAELEAEVARLQQDTISEMSATEEARIEAAQLRGVLEEKESELENLEREVHGLKQVKAETDMKVRDLERKIGALENREIEEKSKRIRIEEDMRDKIDEKEREIHGFRQKIEELERVVAGKGSEVEKWIKEKSNLDEALRVSGEKAGSMEYKILELHEQVREAQKVIETLKEKAVEGVNEAVNGVDSEEKGLKGLKLEWPVVAAGSTGAIIAAAAVIYVCYGKRW